MFTSFSRSLNRGFSDRHRGPSIKSTISGAVASVFGAGSVQALSGFPDGM